SKISKNYAWASGGSSILSEFGTLHLEFAYLTDISGDVVFREKILRIRDFIKGLEKPGGLIPNYLNPKTGKWGQHHTSMGALGDSFYEYLLKAYVQSGYQDETARQMYLDAMGPIIDKLVLKSRSGLTYFAESKFDRLEHKMDHLACFAAGMLALGSHVIKGDQTQRHGEIGAEVANTCHESYVRTPTGLGPESFRFSEASEARAMKSSEKYYILRPEVVEGWFYMWRLTHDPKYRDWAWDAVQVSLEGCELGLGTGGRIQNLLLQVSTHLYVFIL
ncbi:UNVERIFIED_CONTAM: hypothetical protein GTU68_002327, partial [Idotea baltica]|nr:hypothetical protein [Idotea baltica]